MLPKNKFIFLEAFLITIFIFVIGILIGISIENKNNYNSQIFYMNSEADLMDSYIWTSLISEEKDCGVVNEETINFANKVYEKSLLLEEYDKFALLMDDLTMLNKRYTLMKTFLWKSNLDNFNCLNSTKIIVYLYNYNTDDLTIEAEQNVWSRLLMQLKEEDKSLILLPIAANLNVSSLDFLLKEMNIEKIPAVIINNKEIVYDLERKDDLKNIIYR
ncbi:MAG: hypothetical protein PHX15_02910 [Candidatus Nanoarchaeia archaeon]|jgi:hypothetical protein|nr:hypothetical protein [Candidatus Nanoarchaeia archaeon]MDD3994119.1 hypothetical protein [Candidatus Nanoarchaeia archaeon]MDD4563464.1 hypothetical protein [Candidatus Nanoarchaeia archaeon]